MFHCKQITHPPQHQRHPSLSSDNSPRRLSCRATWTWCVPPSQLRAIVSQSRLSFSRAEYPSPRVWFPGIFPRMTQCQLARGAGRVLLRGSIWLRDASNDNCLRRTSRHTSLYKYTYVFSQGSFTTTSPSANGRSYRCQRVKSGTQCSTTLQPRAERPASARDGARVMATHEDNTHVSRPRPYVGEMYGRMHAATDTCT